MSQPVLSICIPTYNRAKYLRNTINSIVQSSVFQNTANVQIVLSNNCSTDETHEICSEYAAKYPDKIKYFKQNEPIISDIHIFKTIEYADGIFCKLNNDTCCFCENSVDDIVDYLKKNNDTDALFLLNKCDFQDNNVKKCTTLSEFLNAVSYECTWIASFCVKKESYKKLENPLRYSFLKLTQVDIYGQLLKNNMNIHVWEKRHFDVQNVEKKGGSYNVAEVFGKNYFTILSEYSDKNNETDKKAIENEKRNVIKFINKYYFNFYNEYNFKQSGYLKYMFPIYKAEPYFYISYLRNLIKILIKVFYDVTKTETEKNIKILGFIRFTIKRRRENNN